MLMTMVPVLMTVSVVMTMPMVIVVALLCRRKTRLVRILLVQAMRLAVAPGHPIELRGGDLTRCKSIA